MLISADCVFMARFQEGRLKRSSRLLGPPVLREPRPRQPLSTAPVPSLQELISLSPRRSSGLFSRTAHGRSMRTRFHPPRDGDGCSYKIKISALNQPTAEFGFKFIVSHL